MILVFQTTKERQLSWMCCRKTHGVNLTVIRRQNDYKKPSNIFTILVVEFICMCNRFVRFLCPTMFHWHWLRDYRICVCGSGFWGCLLIFVYDYLSHTLERTWWCKHWNGQIRVISEEISGNCWEILYAILGHKCHQNHPKRVIRSE